MERTRIRTWAIALLVCTSLFFVGCGGSSSSGGGGGGGLSEIATGAANAGPDQTVLRAATGVQLDASDSHGAGTAASPEGVTPSTYAWVQTGGTVVALSDPAVANPTFDAPAADETLTFEVTVDGTLTDTVDVDVVGLSVDLGDELWVGGWNKAVAITATATPAGSYAYTFTMNGSPLPLEWQPSVTSNVLDMVTPDLTDLVEISPQFGVMGIGGEATARANANSITIKVEVEEATPAADIVVGNGVYSAGTDTTDLTLTTGGLVADAFANGVITFATGGAEYDITANTAGVITVDGDASGETAGDNVTFTLVASATKVVQIIGTTTGNKVVPVGVAQLLNTGLVDTDAAANVITWYGTAPLTLPDGATVDASGPVQMFVPDSSGDNTFICVVNNTGISGEGLDDTDGDTKDNTETSNGNIDPGSLTVTVDPAGTPVVFNDNGDGTLDDGGVNTGTVDYVSGDIVLNWAVAPAADLVVEADYDYTVVKSVSVRAAEFVGVGSVGGRVPDPAKGECAGCHGGQYANISNNNTDWLASDHAKIFENMFSGRYRKDNYKDVSCFSCHTAGYDEVADDENDGFDDRVVAEGVKFSSTADYTDFVNKYPTVADLAGIQCESCHGPGSMHSADTAGTDMIPKTAMCAKCHWGHGHEVDQYWNSVHYVTSHQPTGIDTGHGTRDSCARCHSGQGMANHLAGGADLVLQEQEVGEKTCSTCHDPHTLHLRAEGLVTLENGVSHDFGHAAVCAQCHTGRRDTSVVEDLAISMPHHGSQQAPMLAGTNAFEIAGYTYVNGPHTAAANCVDCHMAGKAAYQYISHGSAADYDYDTIGGHTWKLHAGTATTLADQTSGFTNPTTVAGTREFAVDPGGPFSFVGLVNPGDVIIIDGADAHTGVVAKVMSAYSVLIADPAPSTPTMFTGAAVTNWSIDQEALELTEGCLACHAVSPGFTMLARQDWDGNAGTTTVQATVDQLLTDLRAEIDAAISAEVGVACTLVDYRKGRYLNSVTTDDTDYPEPDGDPNDDGEVWSTNWENIYKATYNYFFVYEEPGAAVHNTGYAIGLLRSSYELLNGAPHAGVDYTAP